MRKKLITLTTAGLIAAGGAAVAVPAMAATDVTGTAATASSQVEKITEALAGLVTDGSITQEQADEVATTLDQADLGGGPGGHGGGPGGGRNLEAAATALNMSEDDLRTALQADGATLASVAETQGVAVDTLIDALVTAGQERIAQAVTDGKMTQEQADERLADLETRITDRVNSTEDDRPQRPTDDAAGNAQDEESQATTTE